MGTNVKQTPIPVVPRNLKMVNADGTPTRSGQLLLQQLQASNTIFGTHDTRPAPGDAPSGALYFETDRGVLYSNENGNWQYVAGTMYATLAPDQRPTDLGQYDGGFEFVANDTDPAIRGRSFIWDGAAWVETTPVLYGTHADRPAVADAPARCLYMETDRGSVIYQNQGTAWQYISGTMFGTVTSIAFTDLQLVAPYPGTVLQTPSRPFGPSDIGATLIITGGTGFTPGTYTLSGLQYDVFGHPTGNAIIVPNAGVAGATGGIGTLPDQRPTDLGPPDAGFDFRTNVDPAREFLWSGGDWVETTPIRYGTHAERLATPIAGLISGMFWTETDRGNVIYETQGGVWLFITGAMWGTLVPDQRPTDLGVNDDGFTYFVTATPLREFIWASPVWVETTGGGGGGTVQAAYATSPLTLTTTPQNVPGCVLTLANAGKYLIQGIFDFSASGDTAFLFGGLTGSTPLAAFLASTGSGRATATQQWVITATAGATAQLNAYKAGGTGSSQASTQSSISALWVSP